MRTFAGICSLTVCLLIGKLVNAGEPLGSEDLFTKGRYEAALTSGVLFSPFIATEGRPTINYTISEVQFGYMLGDTKGSGVFRGNFELLGEAFGSAIFVGPGDYIVGMTIWGRYNFVQPNWRLIPYIQAGAGLTATDIDRQIVGQAFNFNLDLGIGARYLISQKWALMLEYRYQHISNANSAQHNLGINANGPILGVSYLF
jgi:lipid A 3-O-deacylase